LKTNLPIRIVVLKKKIIFTSLGHHTLLAHKELGSVFPGLWIGSGFKNCKNPDSAKMQDLDPDCLLNSPGKFNSAQS
jgi:hypothetical protein